MLSGFQVTVNIAWTQKNRQILDFIRSQFGGSIVYNKITCAYNLTIKRQDTIRLLLSIFAVNQLRGVKRLDYMDACRVYTIMFEGIHLTTLGIILTRIIYAGMNQRRPLTRTMSYNNLYSLFGGPSPSKESFFINLPPIPAPTKVVKVKAKRKVKAKSKS